jgi:hypothetical protein
MHKRDKAAKKKQFSVCRVNFPVNLDDDVKDRQNADLQFGWTSLVFYANF